MLEKMPVQRKSRAKPKDQHKKRKKGNRQATPFIRMMPDTCVRSGQFNPNGSENVCVNGHTMESRNAGRALSASVPLLIDRAIENFQPVDIVKGFIPFQPL